MIASYYEENESGASLQRPAFFKLLADCQPGDILLIEQLDRLSRLNADDWGKLKAE
ncbi:MAG TPA: recombinase family protein [Noviherbaspirillum sp.]